MLTRQPWRRLVHRFSAVTTLLSALSAGAVALAPRSSAASQTGPAAATTATGGPTTTLPGKNPHSPLCQKSHKINLALRNQESNLEKAKSGNWSAYQSLMLSYEKTQSQTAQAVINVGKGVPANVSTAARQEVKNVMVLDRLILKSKNMATLNASWNASGAGSLSAWNTVFYYVGGQCGLVGGSTQGTGQTVGGTSTSPTVSTAG